MGKPVVLSYRGSESKFEHAKLDRASLYGARKRVPLDDTGRPCVRAQLADNGNILIRAGMTAQGYFSADGTWVPNKELVGLDASGQAVPLVASTLGVPQPLEGPLPPHTLLDLEVESVFVLTPTSLDANLKSALDAGQIFQSPFNYGADYRQETAVVFGNAEGYFLAVGMPIAAEWCELANVAVPECDETDDDLDFDML